MCYFKFNKWTLLCLSLLLGPSANANIAEMFGFGSRMSALAGATLSGSSDGFASYTNPATLGWNSDKKLMLSWGMLFMSPSFLPINDITTTNDFASGTASPTTGSADTEYRSTWGQALGVSYQILESKKLTLGFTAYLPLDSVAFFDTGEAFSPEYVLYRCRTQRPQFTLGVGGDLASNLSLGMGIHLGVTQTANANVLLRTSTGPSSMRLTTSLKTKASPYFGLFYKPSDFVQWGAVIRLPLSTDSNMVMGAGAKVLGTVPLDFKLQSSAAVYYDPLTVELGGSFKPLPLWRVSLQADFQRWSTFSPPVLRVENIPGGVEIQNSQNPQFAYKNIWVPRIGNEWSVERTTWRLGYAYRPSMFDGLPTEAGNYLDPPKHMFNVGIGYRFERFLHFDTPINVDAHLSYHQLVTQSITKSPGDETGNGASSKIGAPGYSAGGKIYGGGVSLSLNL